MSFLNLLQYHLSNRKQRTKVDSFFSLWEDILSGVPYVPLLGLLLFTIFMCDMLLILKTVYVTGCANTPFAVADNIEDVTWSLENVGENLITWFSNNQMKLNLENALKCKLLLNKTLKCTCKISIIYDITKTTYSNKCFLQVEIEPLFLSLYVLQSSFKS